MNCLRIVAGLLLLVLPASCRKGDSSTGTGMPPTTRIISSKIWDNNLISIDSASGMLIFRSGDPAIDALEAGSVLVTDAGTGWLRKVTRVAKKGRDWVVETTPAALTDAVWEGTLDHSAKLFRSARLEVPSWSVTMDLEANYRQKIDIHSGELAALTLEFNISLDLDLQTSLPVITADTLQPVFRIPLDTITTAYGLVPVIIQPHLSVSVERSGSTASLPEASIRQSCRFTCRMEYDPVEQWTGNVTDLVRNASCTRLMVDSCTSISLSVIPKLDLKMYGVPAGFISTAFVSHLEAGESNDPFWSLHSSLNIASAVTPGIVDSKTPSTQDLRFSGGRWPVAQGNDRGNFYPEAVFQSLPTTGKLNTEFRFDASGSSDRESLPGDLEVRWDFDGDSLWDIGWSTEKKGSWRYDRTGVFMARLEVRDKAGLTATAYREVIVRADSGEQGTFTYAGRTYAYRTIGSQTWMTENLAWLPSVSPSADGSDTLSRYYVYGYEGNDTLSAMATATYREYGVLYNWTAAKGACPPGWKLPDDEDWKALEHYLGMNETDLAAIGFRSSGDAGKKLKATTGWYNGGNGDNLSGFDALPGGRRNPSGEFYYLGELGLFWSVAADGSDRAWRRGLDYNHQGVYRDYFPPAYGLSVRCIRR